MLAAHVDAHGARLQARAKTRPSKAMLLTLPSGTGKLDEMPDRGEYAADDVGELKEFLGEHGKFYSLP